MTKTCLKSTSILSFWYKWRRHSVAIYFSSKKHNNNNNNNIPIYTVP